MYSILTKCPLFRGLNEDKIKSLIGADGDYTIAKYKDGESIALRGTAYSGLMIVLEGCARGEISYSSGEREVIDTIEAPQLITPSFIFGSYNKLPIDITADGDVTIMTLHRGYLFEIMQSDILIMSNFIDIISNRANKAIVNKNKVVLCEIIK